MYKYKELWISKTFKHGYVYWHVEGRKELFSTLKDAKWFIDNKLNEKNETR